MSADYKHNLLKFMLLNIKHLVRVRRWKWTVKGSKYDRTKKKTAKSGWESEINKLFATSLTTTSHVK